MDRISNLPDNMIDLILKRLVIVESVRTSVLSRSWRNRWTHLSSLNFGLSRLKFDYDLDSAQLVRSSHGGSALAYAYIVNSILSQHIGIIQELSLYFDDSYGLPTFLLFEHSIRKATTSTSLQTLKITSESETLTLPPFIFSATNLRRLTISCFHFHTPSWFKGFPNLTHLSLAKIDNPTAADIVSHFISICPKLEEAIFPDVDFIDQDLELEAPKLKYLQVEGIFKDIVVSNAPNLESVMIYRCHGEEANNLDMWKHFYSFAHVKEISVNHMLCKLMGRCNVIQRLTRFEGIKKLTFTELKFGDEDALKCILSILGVSPNVQKLTLWMRHVTKKVVVVDPLKFESMFKKYINDDFKHLVEVELSLFNGTEVDMKMTELLLRFSPVLELLRIKFSKLSRDVNYQFFNALLNFYRASTKVLEDDQIRVQRVDVSC